MSNRSISFETNSIYAPRVHYERVAYDTLRVLWRHKSLVAVVLGIALAALSVALVLVAPRYTGEAMIQLNFTRDEAIVGEKVQSTAAVDAAAVVDSAARVIRSRAIATAVVTLLGLDNDPAYTRLSLPARALSSVRSAFGVPEPTPHELAVARLMSQTTVANDPRAYLITVAVTASDPKRAAQLANWIASEYLRGQLQEQAAEAYAVAEREMKAVSSVFGPHHPSYVNGSAKLLRLKAELATAQRGGATQEQEAVMARDMVRLAAGQSLLPAEAVMVPSGPNTMLLFALTIFVGLVLGVLLSFLAERWAGPLVDDRAGADAQPPRRLHRHESAFGATPTNSRT
jgi:capsular polysaccharide biosynthesis protein